MFQEDFIQVLTGNRSQNERMMDIADAPFTQVSDEEKSSFAGRIKEVGSYRGYKPRQFWVSRCTVERRYFMLTEVSWVRRSTMAFATRSSTTIVRCQLSARSSTDLEFV